MAKKPVTASPNPGRGRPLTLAPLAKQTKRSIRGLATTLVGQHSTEIAMRL